MTHRLRPALLALATSAALFGPAVPALALEPYQMVRSMQLVQDRVANGDHAAMPMQMRLLGMIDRRFREAAPAEFDDRRNMQALFVYAMSGGNPATLDLVFAKLGPGAQQEAALVRGVGQYLRGDLAGAMQTLRPLDPYSMGRASAPFLALVKGSVFAGEEPATAVVMFDQARLLSPGTLVEEAALRRSLAAAVKLADAPRFLRATSQYARRFIRSPYATQFAEELVKGIVALNDSLDLAQIEATISEMSPAHQKVVYLRLARAGAIEGLNKLSDFAAAKAAGYGDVAAGGDASAKLYANLSSVTSDTAGDVLRDLRSIDRDQLNVQDRQLLDAAIAVAAGVVEPSPKPAPLAPIPDPPEMERMELVPARQAQPAAEKPQAPAQQHEPAARKAEASLPKEQAVPPAPSENHSIDGRQEAIATAGEQPLPIVANTRRKLEEIDKLLTDTQ